MIASPTNIPAVATIEINGVAVPKINVVNAKRFVNSVITMMIIPRVKKKIRAGSITRSKVILYDNILLCEGKKVCLLGGDVFNFYNCARLFAQPIYRQFRHRKDRYLQLS